MPEFLITHPCPCGSGKSLNDCCLPYIEEQCAAPTAEALMRSRYTAYALGKTQYLLNSWHLSTRPATLDWDESVQWQRLEVLAVQQGKEKHKQGKVHFIAYYQHEGETYPQEEYSHFVREGGRWLYVEPKTLPAKSAHPPAVGRNDPCPCGSGKKFKQCCLNAS